MPELPEVETIKNDLKRFIVGKKIIDVRSEWPDIVKMDFEKFKEMVIGTKIIDVRRRAKNLIVELSRNGWGSKKGEEKKDIISGAKRCLLIHFKMSGHIIVTESFREVKNGSWIKKEGDLADPQNQFIRIQFFLDDGNQMAFSDLRRFGYIKLVDDLQLKAVLDEYGPEPLEKGFTPQSFGEILKSQKGQIKKVLMNQKLIAGIGNIYADEILFDAGIHPLKSAKTLSEDEIKKLYNSIKKILSLALKMRGTSTSDYRDARGKRGSYGEIRRVYRRTGEPCLRNCGGKIERISLGGRGTHFCPKCQKL